MRIDPKAPADSPHHPRNVVVAGLQEHLDKITAQVTAEQGIQLPPGTRVVVDTTPLLPEPPEIDPAVREQAIEHLEFVLEDGTPVEGVIDRNAGVLDLSAQALADFTANGQEIEAAVGIEAANEFPPPRKAPAKKAAPKKKAPSARTRQATGTADLEAALAAAGLVADEPKQPRPNRRADRAAARQSEQQ